MRLIASTTGADPGSRSRARRPSTLFVVMVLALGSCTSGDEQRPEALASSPETSPVELKVMEFNVEYGGEQVDFAGVIEAIRAADADVVGIEEAWGNTARIARELGWDYADPRTQIVSRYPLVAPPDARGLYTFVEVEPDRVVAIGNVHLPSAPYGPFKVRDGASRREILTLERSKRIPAVRPTLEALSAMASDDMPVFLLGDFNAPSHLDWTSRTVGIRDHVMYAVRWPVSLAVEKAGLVDSFRAVHPDPVADPGLTWPASRPFVDGYNPGLNGAAADRIDFVYAGGPASPTGSELVGEEGGAGVDIAVEPWPTDHRATVSTFDVDPAVPPTLVAVAQRLVDAGDDVDVTFHAPGEDGERVIVVTAGADATATAVADQPTGGGSPAGGTVAFSTQDWKPAAYDVVLVDGSGDELSRAPLWVRAPGAPPQIETVRRAYDVGDPIRVEWNEAPGNRWDWIGVYKRDANPNVASYIMWDYSSASVEGSLRLDVDANGPWPLDPGKYSVYLLEDDSYHDLAAGTFTVTLRR